MSKKQDFIRSEQSRDKHPEKMMKGSGTDASMRGQAKGNTADHQVPHTGKVANDHNQHGHQEPGQMHESYRTPKSRHDRESQVGSSNQSQSRRGGPGSGQK